MLPVLTAVFFLTGEIALGRILTPVGGAMYFRDEVRELSEQGVRADILFLGTSRVFHSFVPEVFEEEMGLDCVINGGSGTQRPESSYMFLKDLDSQIRPKAIVLGVQWSSLLKETSEAQSTESVITVYDRMSQAGRLKCIFKELGSPVWFDLFPAYRYRYDLRIDKIRENVKKLTNYRKNGFQPKTEAEQYYHGKGFIYAKHSCAPGNIPIMDEGIDTFSEDEIVESNLEYIDRIVDYCKKNDIKLYLVAPLMSLMNLYHVKGYQEAQDFYEKYAEEHGLVFHNLNYLKGREQFFGDDVMTDYVHLCGEGAYRISSIYAEILEKDMRGEDTSEYFYKDLDELKKDVDRVAAVKAKIYSDEDGFSVYAESLHNEDVTPVYRYEISEDNGASYQVIRDWSEESSMKYQRPDGPYILKVYAALSPDDDIPAWMEYPQE